MDVETSLKKLFSLHTFGIKLGLENITGFLNHLNNPQLHLKTIHVAGSNGKGSTSSFISSILQENGFKTGLYTSPHFVKFNERIVINGKQIDDEYVARFISDYEKYIDAHQLTFFEVITAMAFKYFYDKQTDYCVIETGLGGRLDATNVLNPLAVVITTISLEHTNVLGDTISQIATEKAAIIKNGTKVFIGKLDYVAEKIIQDKCSESGSTFFRLLDFIVQNENEFKIQINEQKPLRIDPPLKGFYQKYNSALAVLVLAKTFLIKDEAVYLKGISNVAKNTGLNGRYEYFHKNPTIIFDSAHNPEGVENFLNEFKLEAFSYSKRTLLFGAMKDKAILDMLKPLSNYIDQIFLTEINYERAASVSELSDICKRNNIKGTTIKKPADFVNEFRSKPENQCLVVLGSMYLLGEIKAVLDS